MVSPVGTGPAATLPARWARSWAADPHAPTLIDGVSGSVMDSEELDVSSRRLAGYLCTLGLVRGDRVLWRPGAPVDSAVSAVAILRAGLVLVPVNPRLTIRELRHVVDEIRPAACLTDDSDFARVVSELDESIHLVVPGRAVAGAVAGTEAEAGLDAGEPSDTALIMFTSGTTGNPKGAVHSHASLLANVEALRGAWRWTPDDHLVHALPMFHAHGLCVALFGTLHAGASAVLLPRFGAAEVLDACDRFRATMFFGVPTMYHRIEASGRVAELASLRLAVSGSAALPASLHDAIAAGSGMSILERYGTTETLMSVSNPYEGERRAGTVGFPLPGVEIRLAPTQVLDGVRGVDGAPGYDGDVCDPGDPGAAGELLVRGPSLFAGYFGRPEATEAAFTDGWYRTGDVASVSADGYVRILGRTKELVISGGFNVYPAEVEEVLGEHPAVAEVAVTGTPSDEWGEVVTAWVVPAAGAGDLDLVRSVTEFGAERLAPYKRPRIVRIVPSLPRNALGKVVRHQLDAGA